MAGINRETSFRSQCRRCNCQLQFLILSRSPQHHVADSLRRLHIVKHYCSPRSVWVSLTRATNFLNSLPTIRVLRVTSKPLEAALDVFLPTRHGTPFPDPVPQSVNAIRHAKDNFFSRCPSMPDALVRGRAVSRGSGFLEDADYCSSWIARWTYARPMNFRKRGSWKRSPRIVVCSRNAARNVEIRARCFRCVDVKTAMRSVNGDNF